MSYLQLMGILTLVDLGVVALIALVIVIRDRMRRR